MENLIKADVFFFISSIGFIITGILVIIIAVYIIKIARSFNNILDRIESSMDSIGDTTMELIEDMRDSIIFQMLFRPKKKRHERGDKEKLLK